MRPVSAILVLLLMVTVPLSGCDSSKALHRVKGKAHYADGSPLTAGRVIVDVVPGRSEAAGFIAPDGTFKLGSNTPDDGLPAGTYRAYITNAVTNRPPGFEGNFISQPLIHDRFKSPDTSGLTIEVPKQTEWDIVVEKP